MILIAHRGNLTGPNPELENNPSYVMRALEAGFDAEVDVWAPGGFFLGHDGPAIRVSSNFLTMKGVWCHAKNTETLNELLEIGAHCFCHIKDPCAMTSMGFIWAFPSEPPNVRSICVCPESCSRYDVMSFAGICTDFPISYALRLKGVSN